jgi:hypothetical protein
MHTLLKTSFCKFVVLWAWGHFGDKGRCDSRAAALQNAATENKPDYLNVLQKRSTRSFSFLPTHRRTFGAKRNRLKPYVIFL